MLIFPVLSQASASLPHLQDLVVDDNSLGGELPEDAYFPLRVLNIESNMIEGKLPTWLVPGRLDWV